MKLYKLTDQKMRTYNDFQWELGRWYETSGEGDLCGPGWLHFHTNPLLAVLFNSIHADFKNPRLFEAEGEIGKRNYNIKVGCKRGRVVKEIELPEITTAQRVRWAILCSLEACDQPEYKRWAADWLSEKDRTVAAAWAVDWLSGKDRTAAAACAAAAARTVEVPLVAAAAEARTAVWAAEAAAWATAAAARAAAWTAKVARTAEAAAWAAEAARTAARIPLVRLAKQAIREEVA